MPRYNLLVFAVVYLLAVATPGPGVAAVIARSLARGTRGAAAFIVGFLIGDLIWLTLAVTGLAALAETAQLRADSHRRRGPRERFPPARLATEGNVSRHLAQKLRPRSIGRVQPPSADRKNNCLMRGASKLQRYIMFAP